MNAGVVEKRAAKVAVASGLSMFLSVGLQFLSVPLCLRFWGNDTYGLWLALFAVFNMLRALDVGFSTYVGNELNVLYHRDQVALRKTLASGLAGAIAVGALQLVISVLIVASGTLVELLGVSAEVVRDERAGLALGVLMVGWALTGPSLGIVHRLLVPAGMLHQSTWWFMGFQITQATALVLSAALELEISQTAVLFSTAQLAFYAASGLYVARKLPEYFPWWKQPSWIHGLRALYRSTAVIGANLLIQVSTSGLVMLISAGLGAAAVPAFTTVRTVANIWTMLGNALIGPLLPEVVRYHAKRDGRKLVAALEAHWLIASCGVNLSILACIPFLDGLYRYWTGGRVALDESLLSCLLLAVVVGTPASLIANYLFGINELRATTAIFAARGLVPLGVGFALLPSLGMAGVGIAVVLGEVAGPICLGLPFFRRKLRGLESVPAAPAWRPVVVGTSAVAIFLVVRATGSPHVGAAYVLALAGAGASAVWAWRLVDAEVRERALRLVRGRSA